MNDGERFDLETESERLFDEAVSRIDEQYAYVAGFDEAINGGNNKNLDFRIFRTPELTAAWTEGNIEGRRTKRVLNLILQ